MRGLRGQVQWQVPEKSLRNEGGPNETARNQLQGTEVYQQPQRAHGGFFLEPPVRAKLANNETLVTHLLNYRTARERIWVVLSSVCDNLLEQPSETT